MRRRHAQTTVPAAARRPVEGDQLEPVRPARAGRVGLAVGGEDRLRPATVRYPATRAAAEMALAAAAARTRPGAPVWIYGARVEGVFSAARENGRETVVKRSLFRDVSVVFASACGGFAVVAATPPATFAAGTANAGSTGSKRSRRSCCHARTPVRLFPRASRKSTEPAETVPNWSVYPGLFAGGPGRDDRLFAACDARPIREADERKKRSPFAVLDYCAGSGVLAAGIRSRVPDDAALTLMDADAVALRAAREQL